MNDLWYIIVNPASGRGAVAQRWPLIERQLQELGFAYTVQFTERPGHAIELAEEAVLRGYRRLLGVGGDGTNNEIINGIFRQQAVPPVEVGYTALPVGTGNDWARQYGIPSDSRQRLERLREEKTVLQDVGLVEYQHEGERQQRYFINVAGLAYDGYIGKALLGNRIKIRSRMQYLIMVAQYLLRYQLTEARILFDGQTAQDYFYTINVGLCRYSAGGMQLVPHAVPDDGLFALTFARRLPKWQVMLLTPRFYDGSLLSHPKLSGFQAKSIRVEHVGAEPSPLEADGEYLGETPVTFSLLEKSLKVIL